MIGVKVKEIAFDAAMNPVLLLLSEDESKILPIWIGPYEAHSIAVALEGGTGLRPLTHDLLKACCDEFGASLTRVVINDVRDGTYFAQLHMTRNDAKVVLDARPSDAVALALRSVAPIFITPAVAKFAFSYNELFSEEQQEEMRKLIDEVRAGKHNKNVH